MAWTLVLGYVLNLHNPLPHPSPPPFSTPFSPHINLNMAIYGLQHMASVLGIGVCRLNIDPKSKVHAKYEVNISISLFSTLSLFINNSVFIGEGKSPFFWRGGGVPKFFSLES